MYSKYYTNTKVAKLSQEYLNASIHSYKSNKNKHISASITKTPFNHLNQTNSIPNPKHQGKRNHMMLTLAMNNIAKIQDSIASKPKKTKCSSMSNIEFKCNDNDLDEYELDSTEIQKQSIQPEPLPKKHEYDGFDTINNNHTLLSHRLYNNDNKLLYTLKTLDLENLYNVFNNNSISFNDLFLLTKDDLIEMKIAIGPRNRLLYFAEEYKKTAKEYTINEIREFFDKNKCLVIKQVDSDWNCADGNKMQNNNWKRECIGSATNSGLNSNNNSFCVNEGNQDPRKQHNSVIKLPIESYQSLNNNSQDVKESKSNVNIHDNTNNQCDVSLSQRSKGREESQYNQSKNRLNKENSLINELGNYNTNSKQLQQPKQSQKNSNIITNTNSNTHINNKKYNSNVIKPKNNNSFSQYINQRYEPKCDSYRKQETQIKRTDEGKASKQFVTANNKLPKSQTNYPKPNQSNKYPPNIPSLHSNQMPITFANYEEPKQINLQFSNRSNYNNNNEEDDLKAIIDDDKTNNMHKDSYSTTATLKQASISKSKNKTRLFENANNILNEVESFQQQYESMKMTNDHRRNRVNVLLKKKEGNTNMQTQTNSNHNQSRSMHIADNNNLLLKTNKNNIYNNESERNLNEELKKEYDTHANRPQIHNYNSSGLRKKNCNKNNSMINLAYNNDNNNN